MAVWTIVIMVILAVAIGIFIFLTAVTESINRKKKSATILYPFSGQLSAPNPPWTVAPNKNNPGIGQNPEDGLYLVGMVGGTSNNVPQIQCPAGSKINIVGAFVDVFDPYSECSNTPDNTLKLTCGDSSDITNAAYCSQDSDCGAGMECVATRCVPKACTTNASCGGSSASGTVSTCDEKFGSHCSTTSDCGSSKTLKCINGTCVADPGLTACLACVNGYCTSQPLCQGVNDGLNSTCSPSAGDSNRCRPRDASAYLAAHCDGKQTCLGDASDMWIPSAQGGTKGGMFGPLPCSIPANYSKSPNYAALPAITGWGGGAPPSTQNGSSAPITFSQGYYVHGIYSCVPDDENALTT